MKKKLVEKKKLAAPLVNVFARWTFMAKQNTILYENRKVTFWRREGTRREERAGGRAHEIPGESGGERG